MTVAELQAMSVEDALSFAYSVFASYIGSAGVAANVPADWKNLHRNKLTWNKASVTQGEIDYLLGILLPWGGEYFGALPTFGGVLGTSQLNTAFAAYQNKAYEDNGFSPTRLC